MVKYYDIGWRECVTNPLMGKGWIVAVSLLG